MNFAMLTVLNMSIIWRSLCNNIVLAYCQQHSSHSELSTHWQTKKWSKPL